MEKRSCTAKVCSHRHAFFLDNSIRRLLQSPKKILGPYLQEGDVAFDLGCGPGFFTIAMAELVGESGRVLAVDLQAEMLEEVARKLFDRSLARWVRLHQCSSWSLELSVTDQADFILAYYMVHEVPDQRVFFQELKEALKPEGKVLIVEPPFHVSRKKFADMKTLALELGLRIQEEPRKIGGLGVLLSP